MPTTLNGTFTVTQSGCVNAASTPIENATDREQVIDYPYGWEEVGRRQLLTAIPYKCQSILMVTLNYIHRLHIYLFL